MTKPTLLPTATRMTTLDRLHPIAADVSRANGRTYLAEHVLDSST